MKVIDAHVHIGRHLPADEVSSLLSQSGIDGAVVFADPESYDLSGDNAYVRDERGREGRTFFPFLYVGGNPYSTSRSHPILPPPEALEGYLGIKWHCWFTPAHDSGGGPRGMSREEMDGALSDPALAVLMERAAREGKPVCLEEHFDTTLSFVDRYPEVPVVIPHMGMLNGGSERILAALRGKENVWFDTSLAVPGASTLRRIGTDRVLFGSDYPYGHPGWTLERVRGLGLTPGEEEAVLSGNLLRLLGRVGKG